MNKSIFFALAAAFFWGFSTVFTKKVLAHFEPMSLLLLQLTSSCAVIWTIVACQKRSTLSKREAFKYSLTGLLQPVLSHVLATFGLSLTTATDEALICTLEITIIIAMAWLILRERINVWLGAMALVGIAGTFLAITPSAKVSFAPSMLLGDGLIMVGVFFAAFYNIVIQPQLKKADPLYLLALHQLAAVAVLAPIWMVACPFLAPFSKGTTQDDILTAMICGVTLFALPFWLYLKAVKYLGAVHSSIFLVLPPIFTICGSYIFLGERLSNLQWLGVAVALAAVSAVSIKREEPSGIAELDRELITVR